MMTALPTDTGYEQILVFTALQAAKEGVIKSEYSGTVRLSNYRVDPDFIKKCINAWAAWEYTDPVDVGYDDTVIADMLVKGLLSFDVYHQKYEFTSLNRVYGYVITSELNIPDWGIIAWGVDGLGATYPSSDMPPVLFDQGVTLGDYYAQFPQHGISGSDIILVYPGANALSRLIDGWDPHLKDFVEGVRSHLPVTTP